MSGWIALHRSEERDFLFFNHPNAFLLLTQIATRASLNGNLVNNLEPNQALIGDFKEAGLPTEKAYRHAKKILEKYSFASFRGTNRGTVATLTSTSIYTIRREDREGETGANGGAGQGRTEGQAGGEPRGEPRANRSDNGSTSYDNQDAERGEQRGRQRGRPRANQGAGQGRLSRHKKEEEEEIEYDPFNPDPDPPPAKKRTTRFIKPSLEEVRDYFSERGVKSPRDHAERFVDYYESNGWKVGKNAMKNWKATVRGWISRGRENGSIPPAAKEPSKKEQNRLKALFDDDN